MTTLPSSGELPEELVAEAQEIATAWCAHPLVDGATDTIARALLARDERAASEIASLRKTLSFIHGEAKRANNIIRLGRDGGGQGRVGVATAMHRIEDRAKTYKEG